MVNKKKVPELRFKGFSDDWEQRKLGKLSEKVTEKNKNNIYSETLTNSAEFGIINQREFFDKNISNEKNLDGYYVVHSDDFVYNPRISNLAPVGPIKRNKLGRTGVMSPLYYIFRTHDIDKTYLEKYFSTNSWHKFMRLNGDSGARSDRFSIKDSVLCEMPIPFPSMNEQIKIGEFFKVIDNTLALLQDKLIQYQKLKKAFLQFMFPQNWESVPQVRFAKFSTRWEKRKLGEVAEFNPKSILPEQFEYVDLESVVGTSLISHRTEYREKAPSRAQRLAKQGDIFYQMVRPYQKNNFLFGLPYDNFVFSTGYAQLRPNVDSYFLLCRLQEERFVSNVLDRSTGTSYPAINLKDLAQIEIDIPTFREEQIKIGNFCRKLDSIITLNQSKLDQLKKLKSFLLQKMFV